MYPVMTALCNHPSDSLLIQLYGGCGVAKGISYINTN